MEKYNYKVNNGFNVSKFMTLINVDFIYSTNREENKYLLLNQQAFGEFDYVQIEKQKKTMRIIILNNDTLRMDSYNIPEEELIEALMYMGG